MYNFKEALPNKFLTRISKLLHSKAYKKESPLEVQVVYYIRYRINNGPIPFFRFMKCPFQKLSLGYVLNKDKACLHLSANLINKVGKFQVEYAVVVSNGYPLVVCVLPRE